ncbi:GntR family transcriptional regulator [Candidatus Halocynthiibacter alkanivorans]|uniref:GntR family transcriptional regulator n=1 Tax=Candidatus Halocynthiibacter alkanivorans TaxID=2267619 RepID=UPI000DF3FAAE|nr:GntR family transcriptional regulator [Candidatus Halocynthiibacter alkanivorans]
MDTHTRHSSAPAPAQDVSATQRAYLEIRRMIVVGDLQPGKKLKIDGLRTLLEIGASPIREALSLLTSDQLVERIDQRGFRTAAVSRENFNDILSLRCTLEEMALRQSIANASEAWEDELVLSHHRMLRETRDHIEGFEARHKAFHMALLSASSSPLLLKLCSQLYDLNIRYRYLAGKSLNYTKRDVSSEHDNILRAALERNADQAAELLLSHYRKTGAFLTGLIATSEDTQG